MGVKFGPTKGEYIFRICGGGVILGLLSIAFVSKGFGPGIAAVETFLFGGAFAVVLVGHSTYRIAKGLYRIPQKVQPTGSPWRP